MSTTFYTNEFWVSPVTIAELSSYSQDIVFKDLTAANQSNAISTLKRYDTSNANDTGTDISSRGSISGQVVTLSGVFNANETAVAGTYRVDMVVTSPSRERNMMITVSA